jgi:hypothetical protein
MNARLIQIKLVSHIVLFSILCFTILANTFIVVGRPDAPSRIIEAETSLRQAFEAVLEAERAHATVSDLTMQLHEAGLLLSEAEVALIQNKTDEAVLKADIAASLAQTVEVDAETAKEFALANTQRNVGTTLLFSIIGSALFLIGLLLVWGRIKRSYINELSQMKPEVTSDAES